MSYASSINLGIGQVPDTTSLLTDPNKIAYHLIAVYNALQVLAASVDSYTGNTPVTADNTVSSGTAAGSGVRGYFTADVAIAAGRLVSINAAGHAILADSGAITTLARGLSLGAAAIGAQVSVQLFGPAAIFAAGTFIPGTVYYLGAAGLFAATAPTSNQSQPIGWAISDTTIFFNPSVVSRPAPVTT